MADFADMASDIEQERLPLSLQNRPQFTAHSNYECEDCGEDIPAQRRALGNVKLCIDCQKAVENNSKHYR